MTLFKPGVNNVSWVHSHLYLELSTCDRITQDFFDTRSDQALRKSSRRDCLKMCTVIPIFKQYRISPLSLTPDCSLGLPVCPFVTTINTFHVVRQHVT